MNLNVRNSLVFVCFCMFGIQTGLSFVGEMRDLMNNCARDGGYCINTHLPTPPPRQQKPRRRMGGGRRRPGTRTRKGKRPKPSPQALGAQNTVLPGGRKAVQPAPAQQRPAPAAGQAAFPPQQRQAAPAYTDPFAGLFNFGTGTSGQAGGIDPFYGLMMFTRKKRQAASPVEPFEPGEAPVRMPGQTVFAFMNQHCLKWEADPFGCGKTGGFCCIPHP